MEVQFAYYKIKVIEIGDWDREEECFLPLDRL